MKRDILYKNHVRRSARMADVVVLACTLSDMLCVAAYSGVLFNEVPLASILISCVVAACLDLSLFHAATVLNTPEHQGMRSRRMGKVIGMLAVFIVGYISLLLMAWMVEGDFIHGNYGVLARLLIPIATSILSFFMGFSLSPKGDRLQEINMLRQELQAAIANQEEDCRRTEAVLDKFSVDEYDARVHQLSVTRLKIIATQAENEVCLALAQQLGTTEAVDKLLCSNDLLVDPTALLEDLSQDPASAEVQEDRRRQNKVRLISSS